jgi:two-component system chemotaxis response regulator CheB
MQPKIQVLVVDDSTQCRALISEALSRDDDIEVIGHASSGEEAIDKAFTLRPNVITMAFEMPGLGGLTATERIMAEMPVPILMLTADPRDQAHELTHRSLSAGALALQVKPSVDAGPDAWDLAREVKLLSTVKVPRFTRGMPMVPAPARQRAAPEPASASPVGLVVVASSTGGPQVVRKFLSELPADFPAPVVVVQHINVAYAESLIAWVQADSKLQVRLAHDGDSLVPGVVLMAGAATRLTVPQLGRIAVTSGDSRDEAPLTATVLMESAAAAYGRRCVGLILTGMGQDGVQGMAAIRAAGGVTIAQSRESCMVFGMPGAAIAKGLIDHIIHADQLASAVVTLATGGSLC